MICTACGKNFEKDWRLSRKSRKTTPLFCSLACSHSRHQTEEANKKRSISLLSKDARNCMYCGGRLRRGAKHPYCRKCSPVTLQFINSTKREFFENKKNWQSARSMVQRHARETYMNSANSKKCSIEGCEYSNHIEVAHIKAVSEFDDNATIAEINALSNLMGLCPNHHWDYDHPRK